MFVDSKSHDNLIHHSKELHDMLLEGYRHAVIIKGKAEDEEEKRDDGEGSQEGGGYIKPQKEPIFKNDSMTTYKFDKDGSVVRIVGYENKETARMAYEEHKNSLERQEFDKEEQEKRLSLLDLKKHLKLELNHD